MDYPTESVQYAGSLGLIEGSLWQILLLLFVGAVLVNTFKLQHLFSAALSLLVMVVNLFTSTLGFFVRLFRKALQTGQPRKRS